MKINQNFSVILRIDLHSEAKVQFFFNNLTSPPSQIIVFQGVVTNFTLTYTQKPVGIVFMEVVHAVASLLSFFTQHPRKTFKAVLVTFRIASERRKC